MGVLVREKRVEDNEDVLPSACAASASAVETETRHHDADWRMFDARDGSFETHSREFGIGEDHLRRARGILVFSRHAHGHDISADACLQFVGRALGDYVSLVDQRNPVAVFGFVERR